MLTITASHRNVQLANKSTSKGEDSCSDFTFWSKPDGSCKICRREIYGKTCFANNFIQYETADKELKKMKEKLEEELDEELPSIVEMKSVCDQFTRRKDCLVSYEVNN